MKNTGSRFELLNSHELAPSKSEIFFRLEVRELQPNFHGLFTTEPIPEGSVVARDGGVVLSSIEDIVSDRNYVALIDDGLWLAPKDQDNMEPIFYLNHSCQSNVARYGGLIYISKCDIAAGEQLTIDYAPLISNYNNWKFQCLCETPNCRKVITSDDWKDPFLAKQLWPEWLPFIQKKIRDQFNSTSSIP